jgi:hypothetical protein
MFREFVNYKSRDDFLSRLYCVREIEIKYFLNLNTSKLKI